MVNFHGIHRLLAVTIPDDEGSVNTFITPLLDFSSNLDTATSTANTMGIDSVVDNVAHSQNYSLKASFILNENAMQIVNAIKGNPKVSDEYISSGVISTTSATNKILNYKNNRAFSYIKRITLNIIDTEEPIDFSTASSILSVLDQGRSQVTTYTECTVKSISESSSGTDYTTISLDLMTPFAETHSKLGV